MMPVNVMVKYCCRNNNERYVVVKKKSADNDKLVRGSVCVGGGGYVTMKLCE